MVCFEDLVCTLKYRLGKNSLYYYDAVNSLIYLISTCLWMIKTLSEALVEYKCCSKGAGFTLADMSKMQISRGAFLEIKTSRTTAENWAGSAIFFIHSFESSRHSDPSAYFIFYVERLNLVTFETPNFEGHLFSPKKFLYWAVLTHVIWEYWNVYELDIRSVNLC
jgi:hypothetical protein